MYIKSILGQNTKYTSAYTIFFFRKMSLVIIAARYYRDDTQEAVDVTEHIRGAASSSQLSLSGCMNLCYFLFLNICS